jgi:hypothetical protein
MLGSWRWVHVSKDSMKIPNTVDQVRQFLLNFQERCSELVPGGCPLLNTAIESDDGNPKLRSKARQALHLWLNRLQSIVKEGQRSARFALMSTRPTWLL